MDKKKLGATASSGSGKTDEKKEENFLAKTAHSIRDKVQGLTDDVKEKAHNLTHSGDSKKSKKDKDSKKTDTKPQTSSKPPATASATAKKNSSSDSDDDDDDDSAKPPPSASSGARKDDASGANKSDVSRSKPPSAAAATTTTEKKDTSSSGTSKPQSTKPSASAAASKPSNDEKNTTSASASKPSNNEKNTTSATGSSTSKAPSENPPVKTSSVPAGKTKDPKDNALQTNKPSTEGMNVDKVHISFEGVSTVDDLLDRIDDSIENAKIVFKGGLSKAGRDLKDAPRAPVPSPADLDKKPLEKASKGEQKASSEEPIQIDYNDIHKVDDLILKVNDQPGTRRVVLVNAPGNSAVVTVSKQTNPSTTTAPSATTDESDDSSVPPKSILKTSQNPSSLDTATKTSSFEDDQIHVNIEGIQNVDELLDRVDDAVQNAPVILETQSFVEKRPAPRAPNPTDNQATAQTSTLSQKREAPKSPPSANDQTNKDKFSEKNSQGDSQGSTHKSVDTGDSKQVKSSSKEKKKDEEPSDWI